MWRLGIAAFALAGCSQIFGLDVPTVVGQPTGGDANNTAAIGGTVSGLAGASGLVLQNNGGDDKPVLSDGAFVFPTSVPLGSAYAVTVSVEPTNPSELCRVTMGTGTANADVNDIAVACGAAAYSVGGNVVGLTGSVTLHNGADSLSVGANGVFIFPTKVVSGKPYSVTATGNAACAVFGGTGTVGNADVTSVVVNCGSSSGPYTIGGTINGLNGMVVLRNSSNNDAVSVNSNGTYAFPTPVPSAGSYNVIVSSQPMYPPAAQSCVVSNGTGAANGNVQNINVTCTTTKFTVGGNINGLVGTVVLQDNGADDLSRTTTGPFTFATPIASGSPYSATVLTQPSGQTCLMTNSTGTVSNGNVMNILANCTSNDTGISCGMDSCMGGQGCCNPTGNPHCTGKAGCGALWMGCDDGDECSGGDVCCATPNSTNTDITTVRCDLVCINEQRILCDPAVLNACTGGKTCLAYSLLPGYYACQ
jgi:hypothetical protein